MVIGTAGGDAGEFLAASATYEIVWQTQLKLILCCV